MNPIDRARRVRLQWLLARQLRNWRDVWKCYRAGTVPPPLLFRSGHRLEHGREDAPVFLFLEIFANRCYRRCLPIPAHGVVVDIGANIGAFVLDCARQHEKLTFMAYEPNPRTFEQLMRNVEVNGLSSRVRLYNEAVAAAAGEIRLWSGGSSLESGMTPPPSAVGGTWATVPAVSLSTVVERAGCVALLKIDAEGAEADILADTSALRLVDSVVGEYHEALVPGVLAQVQAALGRAGLTGGVSASARCGPMFHARRTS